MKLLLAVAALAASLPASAATMTETWHFDTLDFDGSGQMRFAPFDGALGTLTGARFHVDGSYRNDALVVLRPFDPPSGTLQIESLFQVRLLAGLGPDVIGTQSFAYDHDLFPVALVLDFAADVPLPQLPDVPLDALTLAPLGGFYSAGSLLAPPLQGGRGAIDGLATLTFEYEPVPEPGTLGLLLGLVLASVGLAIYRKIPLATKARLGYK